MTNFKSTLESPKPSEVIIRFAKYVYSRITKKTNPLLIFDESLHPILKFNDTSELTVRMIGEWIIHLNPPMEVLINGFYCFLKLEHQVVINLFTYRRILLSILCLSTKVILEQPIWGSDFLVLVPWSSSRDLYTLEVTVLKLLSYQSESNLNEYTDAYFTLFYSTMTQ